MCALFIVDTVTLNKRNKVPLRVAAQSRLTKMWIAGNKVLWLDNTISKVTAATAGHEDLFTHLVGFFQHQNATAARACDRRTEQPCRATAENNDIVVF